MGTKKSEGWVLRATFQNKMYTWYIKSTTYFENSFIQNLGNSIVDKKNLKRRMISLRKRLKC